MRSVTYFNKYRLLETGVMITIKSGRVLKPQTSKSNPYPRYNLGIHEGKARTISIHVELVRYFLGGIPEGFEVDHKDGNTLNFNLDNLHTVTHTTNIQKRKGSLEEHEVVRIKRELLKGLSCAEISKLTCIPRQTISDIKFNRAWTHVQV